MLRFDKATNLSLLSKFVLSVKMSNSLLESDVFAVFKIHKYSIHSVL